MVTEEDIEAAKVLANLFSTPRRMDHSTPESSGTPGKSPGPVPAKDLSLALKVLYLSPGRCKPHFLLVSYITFTLK